MHRYKLTIEYFGPAFYGWQRQEDQLTVQGALEQAIFRFCGQHITTQVAGRTDRGVHALAQVAHVDLPTPVAPLTLQKALNCWLRPHPVAVLAVEEMPDTFHARFSATSRAYRYVILNRQGQATVELGRVWHVPARLDVGAMQAAARFLVGQHDFTTFRSTECQARSPVRTLDQLDIARDGDKVTITTSSRSFLHHQVRNIVGTLSLVGRGKWAPDRVQQALDARDRRCGGPTAPAEGLYLTGVSY